MCGSDFDLLTQTQSGDPLIRTEAPPEAGDAFVPFDLFPSPSDDRGDSDEAEVEARAAGGMLTGVLVIAGILGVFVALLVLRPLG